ncbi:hypothetical protein ACXR2U_06135, partial [Jatrophihabitans sp. YIM 134969]
ATPALPRALTTATSAATGTARGRRTVGATVAHVVAMSTPGRESRPGGDVVGELVVSGTVLAARGPGATTAAVHHHLLRLPGGTLAGHGTVDLAGRGDFVVVGGTGRYLGASGAYRLAPAPGGGSILTWEA